MEVVLTGGMDNPVGVTFTRTGEPILCGTFFEPNVPGHRDGLIHSIYGGDYGKINDVTDKFKKTGELMPVMTHMGPAAPCSVIRYESQTFGEDYRDNLFVCQFNMHKVSRHVLEPDGGTFKTKDIDFMTSENPDFHPTCVLEDADGSLLIVDTGGWYKLCCPTSQLAKPDVLGAIYRVRRTGAKPVNDPRGSKINFESMNTTSLTKLLDDPRPWVVRKTVAYLGKTRERGAEAIAMALRSGSSVAKQNALWALSRHDSSSAETLFSNAAFHDKDEQVRLTALKCIALGGKFKAGALLERALEDPSPGIRRVAAEALGRLRDSAAVGPLLAAASESQDRALEHSITYALIQIADPKQTANGLMAKNRAAQSAALIALDQMDNGNLEANTVVRFLSSESERMRTTGMWVARHHPTWGNELAGYFHERLTEGKAGEHTDQLVQQLALFAQSKSIQELLAGTLTDSASSPATRQIVLNAMTVAGLKAVPEQWVKAVSSCLETKEKNDELQRATVATVRAFSAVKTNAPNFSDALMAIGRDESRSRLLRLEAMAALPNGLAAVEPATFEFLRASVKTTEPIEVRSAAVTCLTKAKLGKAQLTQLAQDLREAGPLELTRLLSAFEHTSDESIGIALITALTEAKASSSLRADMVKTLTSKYPEGVQEKAGELLKSLNADAASQNARIEQLLGELKNGDVRRGQLVFNSQKTACASCHAIGYLGGHVGPDLTSIGQVRTERDLLESIVYPSASFVRSYEPFIVNTATDETYNGVLKRDAPDEIVLATGPNAEIRIARSAVRDFRPGTVSVMPAGLTEQISKQDLADLLCFLKATKWGAQ